ncbi:MAG: rhamnulokinase [Clostridiales bacterium]|jgi:sugar (pentulose or hexulose) kinase|nr:rhamnulokinase [Clostridiales bacterium]
MDYLAFDLGASGGKLFRGVYNGSLLALSEVHRFYNTAVALGSGIYWDFLRIWQNLTIGLQKANREGVSRSFGVDSFSNDFSFIDKSGELLAPMRCYRDKRTARCAEAIYQKMTRRELYGESGNQIAPFNTLMQLAAMREERKDAVIDAAHRLLFLPDLIAYYITGETLAERTVSSVSQMYRFDTEDWSDTILDTFHLPRRLFGTLIDPGTISGKASRDFRGHLGIGGFNFVSVCEHDTASAFLALPNDGDRAIISSGTWSLVGCEVKNPIINDYGFRHNIANEGSFPGHHRLLLNVMGSWLLQELRADLQADGQDYNFVQLEALARESSEFAFLIDVDDVRFFSPGDVRRKIRETCFARNHALPETAGQFARCICESLALKYRWALDKLETLTGRKFPEISIIGGGSKDALICGMTADACSRLVVAGPWEASSLGNILAQLLAFGEIKNIAEGRELIDRSFSQCCYYPEQSERWEQIYMKFTEHFGLE